MLQHGIDPGVIRVWYQCACVHALLLHDREDEAWETGERALVRNPSVIGSPLLEIKQISPSGREDTCVTLHCVFAHLLAAWLQWPQKSQSGKLSQHPSSPLLVEPWPWPHDFNFFCEELYHTLHIIKISKDTSSHETCSSFPIVYFKY